MRWLSVIIQTFCNETQSCNDKMEHYTSQSSSVSDQIPAYIYTPVIQSCNATLNLYTHQSSSKPYQIPVYIFSHWFNKCFATTCLSMFVRMCHTDLSCYVLCRSLSLICAISTPPFLPDYCYLSGAPVRRLPDNCQMHHQTSVNFHQISVRQLSMCKSWHQFK